MGISLEDVIENELLSPDVIDCIPETCECGSPIYFTESLRQIYCSNARCIYKVAARLEAMAKAMKVDGFGESTCQEICRHFKLMSPFQVFLLQDEVANGRVCGVSAFEKKINAICDKDVRKVELWEVVKLAGIPNIETIAYKIFNGYDNFTDAYLDIENGEVPFIANKLGIKNADGSILAVNVYNTLLDYKEELLFGETQFDIFKPDGDVISIAITDSVSGFRNKSEFIDYINSRYKGKINAMFMGSMSKDIDILVADGSTGSNKYEKACKINAKHIEDGLNKGWFTQGEIGLYKDEKDLHPVGEKVLITTSSDLINTLDRIYG